MKIYHTANGLQQTKTNDNNRNVESNVIENTNENTKDVNKNKLMIHKMKHEQTNTEPMNK